ncbi:unnamed protein product [Symbiodinium sp. CCMP2592]|nr:unnamed protein product [Symbiodinium sp. CCMP2592]
MGWLPVRVEVKMLAEAPSLVLQPDVFDFLHVQEILNLRVASRRAVDSEALAKHVEDMAGFGVPHAVASCFDLLENMALSSVRGESEQDMRKRVMTRDFGDDIVKQKQQLCRLWLLVQVCEQHFKTSDDMVQRLVSDCMACCTDRDLTIRRAGHSFLKFCSGKTGHQHVRQRIDSFMFELAISCLPSPEGNWRFAKPAMAYAFFKAHSLSPAERQQWFLLLAQFLPLVSNLKCQTFMLNVLKELRRVDDAPCETYAEGFDILRHLAESSQQSLVDAIRSAGFSPPVVPPSVPPSDPRTRHEKIFWSSLLSVF